VYNSKRQTTELVLLPIRKILRLPFVSPLLLTHPQLLFNYGRTARAALWHFVRAAKITRSSPTQKFFLSQQFLPLCRPGSTKKMSLLFRRLLFVIFMLG
jgi:hypothetical protein